MALGKNGKSGLTRDIRIRSGPFSQYCCSHDDRTMDDAMTQYKSGGGRLLNSGAGGGIGMLVKE